MDIDVAERVQVGDTVAVRVRSSEHGTDARKAVAGPLAAQDEWRWSPDPAEVALPPTPGGQELARCSDLIRALAWASAHFWG